MKLFGNILTILAISTRNPTSHVTSNATHLKKNVAQITILRQKMRNDLENFLWPFYAVLFPPGGNKCKNGKQLFPVVHESQAALFCH
jgi:hypothetical protein